MILRVMLCTVAQILNISSPFFSLLLYIHLITRHVSLMWELMHGSKVCIYSAALLKSVVCVFRGVVCVWTYMFEVLCMTFPNLHTSN